MKVLPGDMVAAADLELCPLIFRSWVSPNLFPGNRGAKEPDLGLMRQESFVLKLGSQPCHKFCFLGKV